MLVGYVSRLFMFLLWAWLQLHSGLCDQHPSQTPGWGIALLPAPESWAPQENDGYDSKFLSSAALSLGSCHALFPLSEHSCSVFSALPFLVGFLQAHTQLSYLITVYPLLRQSTSKACGPWFPSHRFQPSSLFSQDSMDKSRGPAIKLPEFKNPVHRLSACVNGTRGLASLRHSVSSSVKWHHQGLSLWSYSEDCMS